MFVSLLYHRKRDPNSISWEYDPNSKILSIDEYEKNRPARRSHIEMVLPRSVRTSMLRKEWDCTQRQIAEAVRNNIRIKNQRRATVNNLDKADKMEEMMENAGKKLMRGLLMKKSTSQKVAELERQWQEAEKQRKQAELMLQMAGEYDPQQSSDDGGDEENDDEDPTVPEDEEESPAEDEKEEEEVLTDMNKNKMKSARGKENIIRNTMKAVVIAEESSDDSADSRQTEGEATAEGTNNNPTKEVTVEL